MLAELKECFLEAYDDNQDGKIDIREVSACRKKYVQGKKKGFFYNQNHLRVSATSWLAQLNLKLPPPPCILARIRTCLSDKWVKGGGEKKIHVSV